MRRFPLIALIASAATALGAIDFTPTVVPYRSEGAEYTNVIFKDEPREISITLPRLWTCRGNGSRLQLIPPNESFAEGVVQSATIKGLVAFDEATVKSLERQVLATLPPGSFGGTILSEQENPILLYQNLSYEFVASYQTLGQSFQRSIIIVSCPDQQLIFRFSAPKSAFAKLNEDFRRSIWSWHWTEVSPPKTAPQGQAPAVASR